MARIIEVYDPDGSADAAVLSRAKRNIEGIRGSLREIIDCAQAWADRCRVRVWIDTGRKGQTRCILPRPRPEPQPNETEVRS